MWIGGRGRSARQPPPKVVTTDVQWHSPAAKLLCVGGHTRHRIKERRVRRRLVVAFFFGFMPIPGLTGGCGRTGCFPAQPGLAETVAILAVPIAVYAMITALKIWRSPTWAPWDARLGRSVMCLLLRDGRGRRRGRPDSS